MKSMTGYAFKESLNENITVSTEIKGYNNRFLDIWIHLPPWLSALETGIRKYISSRFTRGKIDVNIRLKEANAQVSVSVNESAAMGYKTALERLALTLDMKEKPTLEMIMDLDGVLDIEKNRDIEKYWDYIEPILGAAADEFEADRIREGKYTEADIISHIVTLEENVITVNSYVPALEAAIKENLRERFTELLGERVDETRIFAETAVLLMKHSISEELVRLSSHLLEFRTEIDRNPSPGKKLDFICQEINREVNTIGSKTPMLEVSRAVIEMKNALENIREQLRNVE
jgi:uncharacterized protein (TIGR00255 family)